MLLSPVVIASSDVTPTERLKFAALVVEDGSLPTYRELVSDKTSSNPRSVEDPLLPLPVAAVVIEVPSAKAIPFKYTVAPWSCAI